MKQNQILIALAILVLCIASFSGGLVGYHLGKKTCLEVTQTDTVRVVVHDSISIKTNVHSKPRKTIRFKSGVHSSQNVNIDTIHCDTLRLITRELITLADTAFYSDTLRNDTSYNIVVNDTIVGHRLGLGVEFKNLRPLVKETITNTVVKKQWQLYGIIQIPTNGKTVSVIPTVEITTPFGLCFGYGFEPISNRHVPNIGYSFRFGKK
jgi:hypothetical protein